MFSVAATRPGEIAGPESGTRRHATAALARRGLRRSSSRSESEDKCLPNEAVMVAMVGASRPAGGWRAASRFAARGSVRQQTAAGRGAPGSNRDGTESQTSRFRGRRCQHSSYSRHGVLMRICAGVVSSTEFITSVVSGATVIAMPNPGSPLREEAHQYSCGQKEGQTEGSLL